MPLRFYPLRSALAALALLCPILPDHHAASAQPVVQPLPSDEVQRLNRALVDLAKRPRDLGALLEAGDAALAVNDLEAAGGFFERARELDSENAAAEFGLARLALRRGQPVEALELIERALAMGAPLLDVLGERGLAYDMVAQQGLAQADYRLLLEAGPDPVILRRLAISHAIEGQLAEFERILRPQLERRDPAAFRTRTFGLAIMGQETRAAAIVEAVMPARLASEITPYLAFMPRLTPAQQAAAANLGIFPSPADMGRDTLQIANYTPPATASATATATATASSGAGAAPSASAAQAGGSMPAERIADARLAPRGEPLGAPATAPSPAKAPALPPADPAGAAPAPEPAEPTASVADAFADIALADDSAMAPQAGAVDLASIAIPREAPPAPARPDHPSRIWVQVATGRDLAALGFDWRRLARKAPDLLGGFTAHTVPWGEANRLLAGPVGSAEAARDLINELKAKGIETFSYTSPEGQQIQELE